MNKKLQEIINNNLRKYFDYSVKRELNIIKLNTHNTKMHELKKTEIAYNLQKAGHSFICEGKLLSDNGRPDITVLDLKEPIAYEIIHSETNESLETKRKKYPFKFLVVKA